MHFGPKTNKHMANKLLQNLEMCYEHLVSHGLDDSKFIDPQGRVKPGCRFRMPKEVEKENNLNNKSLEEIFKGDFMNDIRANMLEGKRVPGCIRCYQEEDSGKKIL